MKRLALIKRTIVYNVILVSDEDLREGVVISEDSIVQIGDIYENENFYRESLLDNNNLITIEEYIYERRCLDICALLINNKKLYSNVEDSFKLKVFEILQKYIKEKFITQDQFDELILK